MIVKTRFERIIMARADTSPSAMTALVRRCRIMILFSCLFGQAVVAENASNPLAKVKNTDLRWQYLDVDGDHINDLFIDGAFMANDQVKIKYELHYWETDLSGHSEQHLESSTIKAIYFPKDVKVENSSLKGYRLAVGFDWIVDHGDEDKFIGSGSDQIAPFAGVALGYEGGLVVIPLVQHFVEYSGDPVNTTALRLIALQPLPETVWLKYDVILPVDWENDNDMPATAELQLGKFHTKGFGTYVDFLAGIGSDRPYDWGLGVGLRFKY